MQYLTKMALLSALLFISSYSQASLLSLSGDGNYAGSVISDNGWTANMGSGEVDFWTFSLTQDVTLSIDVVADIVFGISLYSGTLLTDPAFNFSNFAGFDGLWGEELNYVAGTDPFTPLSGDSLSNINLSAGDYTLALGGNDFGFNSFSQFSYLMNISSQVIAPVSEPQAGFLLLALAGLFGLRKRKLK
ncbi:PEP-CTERM sorting domain-containing protein [Paraglaciecola sp.]|uniref:PEP-CTERM sorting domain-containing protein n=1 Tax=Paraglaciecola sp. TaxID=1920173 RepID=UPI0030F4062A